MERMMGGLKACCSADKRHESEFFPAWHGEARTLSRRFEMAREDRSVPRHVGVTAMATSRGNPSTVRGRAVARPARKGIP
jgi:hypothetical protein